jgi:hypothetical protein
MPVLENATKGQLRLPINMHVTIARFRWGTMTRMLPHTRTSASLRCLLGLAAGLLILSIHCAAQTTNGYLGIKLRDLPPERLTALKLTHGIEITAVDASGPAAKAGLKEQDVIFTLDGQPLADRNEMQSFVQRNPGRAVKVGLIRGSEKITLLVQLAVRAISVEDEAREHAEAFGRTAFAHCDDPADIYCIGLFFEIPASCSDVFLKLPRVAKRCETVVQVHATADPPFTFDGTDRLSPNQIAAGLQWLLPESLRIMLETEEVFLARLSWV